MSASWAADYRGCSTALHLAERGYRVALLEGRRIAWGASGRSGGQAIAGFASSQDTLAEQVGLDAARRMWDVSVEAVELLKERIQRHSIDCDLHWGQMHVAVKPRHVTELKAWQQEMTGTYAYPARAGSSATRYGSGSRPTVTSAGSMTPAAATCTRSTTRLVSPPRRKPQVSGSSRTAR